MQRAGDSVNLHFGWWPTYPVAHICLPLANVGLCPQLATGYWQLFFSPTEHLPVTGVTDAASEFIAECADNLTTPSTILPLYEV